MTRTRKILAAMGILVAAGLVALVASYFNVIAARKETVRLEENMKSLTTIANELFKIHAIREKLQRGTGSDGGRLLSNEMLLNLSRNHQLGECVVSNAEETRNNIRTSIFKMSLKGEYLENIINFMIDIEKVPNCRIDGMSLLRDDKNNDKWDANNLSIVQLLAD